MQHELIIPRTRYCCLKSHHVYVAVHTGFNRASALASETRLEMRWGVQGNVWVERATSTKPTVIYCTTNETAMKSCIMEKKKILNSDVDTTTEYNCFYAVLKRAHRSIIQTAGSRQSLSVDGPVDRFIINVITTKNRAVLAAGRGGVIFWEIGTGWYPWSLRQWKPVTADTSV